MQEPIGRRRAAVQVLVFLVVLAMKVPLGQANTALGQSASRSTTQASKSDAKLPKFPRTWDECGAKPDDPNFDNGPILSRILAAQCERKIKTCPVGCLGDYYVKTPVVWPQWTGGCLEGSGGYTYALSTGTIGCTRLVWAGPKGGVIVDYHGTGGRISKLILCGGPLTNEYQSVAGCGVQVSAHMAPPSGNLVTDQLAIVQCDVGIHCLDTPDHNHADLMKHYGLLTHFVRVPYWVEGDQSCPHWFFGFDCRGAYETVFKFDKGGSLFASGVYVGDSLPGGTLLYVGRSNDHVGRYEISGLQVDGSARDLTLVSHGTFLFDCIISGNIGKPEYLAKEPVVAREGKTKYANITINLRQFKWPAKGR